MRSRPIRSIPGHRGYPCHGAPRRSRARRSGASRSRGTCDPQHATGVLLVDALPIRSSEPDRIEIGDRLADELRTLLGIEGHVAAEEHVVDAEKLDRTTKGVFGAEERGVSIEHLVIVERTLAQPSRERAEVLLGRARA